MKAKRLLFTMLCMMMLTACTDTVSEDNNGGEAVPMDPGKGYTERTVSVNRDGKEAGTVTLRFYDDMPNVAYIAATAYYRMMLPSATMTVTNQGTTYLLTTAGGAATVDVVNDALESTSYNDFVSLMSLTAPDQPSFETSKSRFIKYDSHQYEPAAAPLVKLDFRKYGIDLRDDGKETYFPFATINDMFTDACMHMAGYNGSRILVNTDDTKDLSDLDADFSAPAYQLAEVGDDLAQFRYGELCFVIDYFYGYPGRNLLEKQGLRTKGLDATLDAVSGGKETKQLLKSKNQAEFALGTAALNCLLADGGHTAVSVIRFAPESVNEAFVTRYNAASATLPAVIVQMMTAADKATTERSELRTTMTSLRNARYGSDTRYVTSQDGKTAVVVLKLFMEVNYTGWQNYYTNGCTSTYWQAMVSDKNHPDIVVQTVEALQQARRSGVKNVVLDVSLNTGGEDDPVGTLVALLGDRTAPNSPRRYSPSWDQNMLTSRYLTKTFVVDRNFDGVFDDRDNETDWVGDLNIVVMTSEITFSNGSVFAAKMKDYGYKTWGRRSGGGACSIAQYVTPDGMIYQISSSRSHTTYKNRESIDSGTPVDNELTNEQMYDIEYLNKQFR